MPDSHHAALERLDRLEAEQSRQIRERHKAVPASGGAAARGGSTTTVEGATA